MYLEIKILLITQVSHLYKIIENQRKKTGKVVII